MEGLNIVLKSLYDVTLQNVEPQNGELWSDEVYKLVHPFSSILYYTIYYTLHIKCAGIQMLMFIHCVCDYLTAGGCI